MGTLGGALYMENLKKAYYWLDLSEDDIETAKWLLEGKRFLHMGFFCHLAVEKSLKAVAAYTTNSVPPKIHDLLKLAKLSGVLELLSEEQINFLEQLTPLQIEARYPEYKERIAKALNEEKCKLIFAATEEFLCWIKKKLER
jgi:HEPN domain-containing protein